MKIGSKIACYIKGITPIKSNSVSKVTLRDRISKPLNIPTGSFNRNTLSVKKDFWGCYQFRENGKKVGFADVCVYKHDYAPLSDFPEDWFVKGGTPNKKGQYPLKPYMYVIELSVKDRINKQKLIPRKKKYGTMMMQHVLHMANAKGCDTRICLYADTLGKTGFKPGKFYNKIGFSLHPDTVRLYDKVEKRYRKEFADLQRMGYLEEKIIQILNEKSIFLPPKANGRYVANDGEMFLTNPEDLIYYNI